MSFKNNISLNGDFTMDFLGGEVYSSHEEPRFEGFNIPSAVPGYWEDMLDEFRKTRLHTKLEWNPLYTLQRYPQAGYVPDMALPTVLGCFAYKKCFFIDSIPDCTAVLYVGGAHNTLSAFINGIFIGAHKGYSSEFYLDIPEGVLLSGENRITLVVSNIRQEGYMDRPVSGCTARAANECTGGIYGDVEIRFLADGVRSLRASTSADLSSVSVIIDGPLSTQSTLTLFDGRKAVREITVEAGETNIVFSTEGLSLWSPDSPKLYRAVLKNPLSEHSFKFGIRRLCSVGTQLYLNGKPFMFRAICEHGYYPLTVHPPRDIRYYRAVIRKMKELGFNAIRFHTWVPMAEYMSAADELGVLIEVETPNNTTYAEWVDIVHYTARFTSPVMYSSGNEMVIDEDYIEHLRACAELVHGCSDSLFSPMSAMRGIEYHSWGDCKVEEPFPHNPIRLAALGEFCDVYNTYSRGGTSYRSDGGDPEYLDRCNAIYRKPLLSHEICINGTYIDLSLKDRYRGSRIGDTELFSSVERHLEEKGLLDRAPLYYKNSVEWQRRMRKHCFEICRRAESFAGYDFLGDIDHHWHTFGYCVGMMNEFYELKPGETVENVRRYNADTVLLADLPRSVNYLAGENVVIPVLVSHYAEALESATLNIRIVGGGKVYLRREIRVNNVKSGAITELYKLKFTMPRTEEPIMLKLVVGLSGGDTDANNEWELYVFPKTKTAAPTKKACRELGAVIADDMTKDELLSALRAGKRVLLFSAGPFARLKNSFQISIAGRTEGHLATAIHDSPLMRGFPHEGFCSWQFREMLTDSHTALLDIPSADFAPIIESASSYKNARREAIMFEYKVGEGQLLICTLNLKDTDPGAAWLRSRIYEYFMSEEFTPECSLSLYELESLCTSESISVAENSNAAQNMNDITMRVKKK